MIEPINLKSLANKKLHIEKLKSKQELELKTLIEEYESDIQSLINKNKEQLEKSGELYDAVNNITLQPIYADREVDTNKLYDELPDKYWKVAHIPINVICECLGKEYLEKQILDKDSSDTKEEYRKIVTITIKDAKKELTKREMEDYWLPRKIIKYDLDLKIK